MNQTKCYFNRKKYISFTDHDIKDGFFETKQQKMVRYVQKKKKLLTFLSFPKKKFIKMIVFYKKQKSDTLMLEKVYPYQNGR